MIYQVVLNETKGGAKVQRRLFRSQVITDCFDFVNRRAICPDEKIANQKYLVVDSLGQIQNKQK